MRRYKSLLILPLAIFLSGESLAQEPIPQESSPQQQPTEVLGMECIQQEECGDCCDRETLFTRPTLTGDWGGIRSGLKESGVTFAGRSTHFAFGVNGGITGPFVPPPFALGDSFAYTGRGEYDLNFDLEKFGGVPYGSLLVRMEHWYGEYGNVSLRTGSFPPPVFPAALPPAADAPGELFLSNFVITQPLSENFVLFAGKKDVLGAADQDVFAGGDGTDQFMNQAFVANPAFLLGLPYTGFVVGTAMPQDWGLISAFAYDPKDRTRDAFEFGDLYAAGVIVGTEVKVNTNVLDFPGEAHVGGMWKHVDLTDLRFNEPPPGVYPEPTAPGFPTLSDSWTIYVGGDQYFVTFSDEPTKGWGLFARASISDGNPTPIRHFLSAGLGGDSGLRVDKKDKWGLGWYYVGASSEFGPLPQFLYGPRNGTGCELFYNFQVTPWLNITPDVQYIRPEAGAIADDAFVYGIRVNALL